MRTIHLVSTGIVSLAAAGATYVHGVWVSSALVLRPLSEFCHAKPLGEPPVVQAWFPLTYQCRWSDGTGTDLVPAYVNPFLFVFLAVSAACLLLSVRNVIRDRTSHN